MRCLLVFSVREVQRALAARPEPCRCRELRSTVTCTGSLIKVKKMKKSKSILGKKSLYLLVALIACVVIYYSILPSQKQIDERANRALFLADVKQYCFEAKRDNLPSNLTGFKVFLNKIGHERFLQEIGIKYTVNLEDCSITDLQ